MSTKTRTDTNRLYFAYGSNMDESQMKVRCFGHELVGPGRLDGYRFRINTRGVATVVPEEGAVVHGLVWSISAGDEASLDVYEGVAHGLYLKEQMQVTLADGDRAETLIYVAADSSSGRSRDGYLAKIVRAAVRHGLPDDYIHELKGWN